MIVKWIAKRKIKKVMGDFIADVVALFGDYDMNASVKIDPIKREAMIVFSPRRKTHDESEEVTAP